MACTGKRNQKIVDGNRSVKVSFSRKYDDYNGNTILRLTCRDENTCILLLNMFQKVLLGTNLLDPVKSLERDRKSCLRS